MFILSMDIDSSGIDSLKRYEIPEVIEFECDPAPWPYRYARIQDIVPDYHIIDTRHALQQTSLIISETSITRPLAVLSQGQINRYPCISLNNHPLHNELLGFIDLDVLSLQCAEKVILRNDQRYPPGIDIKTKTSHYDQPFSFVQYAMGSNNSDMYTADLSRPITDDLGFYLNGTHSTGTGHRPNNGHAANSFYLNCYWLNMIPGRFDIVYSSRTKGFPGTDQDTLDRTMRNNLIDASVCIGGKNHKINIYFNMLSEEGIASDTISLFKNGIKNIGFNTLNHHDLFSIQCDYGFSGVLNMIESDVFDTADQDRLSFWAGITKTFNAFSVSGSGMFDLQNREDLYINPKFVAGMKIIDSIYAFASLARYYRAPSIPETHMPDSAFLSYYPFTADPDLETEYYWAQELGIKNHNLRISLYKHDYDNRIVYRAGPWDEITVQNMRSWQTVGIQSSLGAQVYLAKNETRKTTTVISAEYNADYIFTGYTLPLLPRGTSTASITFERLTPKYTVGCTFQEKFIDEHEVLLANTVAASRVFSALGYIRIVDLYVSLSCRNIFDQTYFFIPDYTMPPRNYSLAVKWNFWD
jgi:hypothetical protein